MEKSFYDFQTEPLGRSSFLTWLCILTFIGSGWSILSSAFTYSSASKFSKRAVGFKQSRHDSLSQKDSVHIKDTVNFNEAKRTPEFEKRMQNAFVKVMTEDNIRRGAIGAIIAALFTLSGALLMWRLKRVGFYLYILGVLIAAIVPFYLYGSNFIAVGISSFGSFFGLIFIALYALNLKSLK